MHTADLLKYHNRQTAKLVLCWLFIFFYALWFSHKVYIDSQKVPEVYFHVKIIDISTITYEKTLDKRTYCGLIESLMDRVGRPTDPNYTVHECPKIQKALNAEKPI